MAASDRRILDSGDTYEAEETLQVGEQDRTYLTVKFPFVDEEGQITGITGISTDITGKKQAEALQQELTEAQQQAIEELRASHQETVERLARAIERHDAETGEHVNRMAALAAFLAGRLGLDENWVYLMRTAAPMHDVGKIAISDSILKKPGPLTAEERAEMENHTTVGYEILADSKSALLQMAAAIALSHHERWDGNGYPRGLSEESIPLEGRIVAVADVFDALLSNRRYRPAMSVPEAVAIIRDGKGSHFDPSVADVLLDHLEEALFFRQRSPDSR